MTLRLSIANLDRLPDGGPLRIEVKGRGLDIGRDAHLDWTLPDPSRHISSKHCEIRYRDGGYWLHDVSTNGTYLNGAQYRLDAPHLLRSGDRLSIGAYIVAVEVEAQAAPPAFAPAARAGADVWGAVGEAAAPDDRNAYRPRKAQEAPVDFLDFASPLASGMPVSGSVSPPRPDDAWLSAIPTSQPAPPQLVAPVAPTPRRPAPGAIESSPAPFGPPPIAAPATAPSTAQTAGPPSDVLARIAVAAGIPERAIAGRDPHALADEIGSALRLTVQNLAQLLASRAETKTLIRSSSRTMIRALENNPLKFTGAPGEALAIMFGPATQHYLDARATLEQSFDDLKAHQLLTFGAMQSALEALFEDLAPENIDRSVEPDRGLGGLVGSRKAKLWDVFVERWRAKTKRADGRLNEAFIALFAEAYDRLQSKRG
jgi:type VI secretion system protein ImpI